MMMDENVDYAIHLEWGTGIAGGWDGMCDGNSVASYTHIHSREKSAQKNLCRSLRLCASVVKSVNHL